MWKMHLIARAPNEGARRLAWWIGTRRDGPRQLLAASVSASMVDRLLRGEVIPGADLRWRIAQATAGAVGMGSWGTTARGRWGDRPSGSFGSEPAMLSPGRRVTMADIERDRGRWRSHVNRTPSSAQALA